MTAKDQTIATQQPRSESKPPSEEIIRQLEEFPIEALEAALLVVQMRQESSK